MVNGSNELIFKLVIDGKEAVATLDLTKGEFVETGAAADKTKEQMEAALTALKQKLNETTSEAKKVHSTLSQIGEDNNFGKNLGAEFDGVNVTVRDLLERLADLKKNFQGAPIGGEEFGRWTRELNAIQEQLDAVTNKTRITTLANEGLTSEVLKYTAVNDQSVRGISEYITSQNLSSETIEKTISALDLEIKSLGINSEAWKQKTAAAANLKAAYGQVITQNAQLGTAQNNAAAGMNKMNLAMGQFGYLVGDADMFLVNFRMGLMSIGNNIPMVVQYLQYAKQEASSLNMTLGQAFMQSIAGPGGLLLGVNAAVFAMQLIARFTSQSTEEIKKQKDEIDKLRDSYQKLSKQQIDSKEMELRTKLAAEPYVISKGMPGMGIKSEQLYTSETGQKLKEQLDLLIQVKNNMGDLEKLENRRVELNEKISKLKNIDDGLISPHALALLKQYQAELKNLDARIDSINNKTKDGSAALLKQFNAAESKSLEEQFKNEMEVQIEREINSKNYNQLLEMMANAQDKYQEHLDGFHKIKNKTELQGWNLIDEIMKAALEKMKKALDEAEKDMDESAKKAMENRKRRYDEQMKWEEEKKKFERELPAKTESDPYERQKKQLDSEEALTVERAAMYGATEEEITNIHAYYSRQREQIDFQANQNRLQQTSQMLKQLGGLFAQHTMAYKLLSSASALIDSYQAAEAAYKAMVGIPVIGPVLAPIAYATALAKGFATVVEINSVKVPGYETGGRLPQGKFGFFEGTKNEIVAPEEDFMTVAHELIGRSIIEARNYLAVSNGASGDSSLINRLEAKFDQLEKTLADRISIAVFDNDTAEEIGRHVDIANRKAR